LIKNGTVDGKASNLFSSATSTFAAATTANLTTGLRTGWSSAANTQSTGKVFVADITVSPILGGTTTMNGPITDDAELDGS
ncbi:TPA: fimbrial assembly protein, partial [Yersinia enterocolitica]